MLNPLMMHHQGLMSGATVDGGLYYNAVIALSPISYFRLGETSGTVAANSGTGADGEYLDSPGQGASSLLNDGSTDLAVEMSGSDNGRVLTNTNTSLTGESYSYVWLMHPDSTGEGGFGRIFSSEAATNAAGGTGIYLSSPNNLRVRVNAGTTYSETMTTSKYLLGVTSHCTLVSSISGVTLYIDGVQEFTSSFNDGSAGNFLIGNQYGLNRSFDGTVDEWAVFDYELNSTQVADLFTASGL